MASSSSLRERSRSPLRVAPMCELARAALDVVCKHDADPRVEEQRATIARLQRELQEKNDRIFELNLEVESLRIMAREGHLVEMGAVWTRIGEMLPNRRPSADLAMSTERLYDFLINLRCNAELLQLGIMGQCELRR